MCLFFIKLRLVTYIVMMKMIPFGEKKNRNLHESIFEELNSKRR